MRSVIHVDGSKDIKTDEMSEYNYGDFVKPEVALQLKGLGFDSVCEYYYLNPNEKLGKYPNRWYKFPENWNSLPSRVSCPTYPEALKWFFETKKLFASIRITPIGFLYYEIWFGKTPNDWKMVAFSNAIEYTEIDKIHEDCLKRLIELANKNDL